MQNYADVLESYLIAEEGFVDSLKKAGKAIWDKVVKAIMWLINKFKELINKLRRRKADRNDEEAVSDAAMQKFENDIKQMPGVLKKIQEGISIADREILPSLQKAAFKHPPECIDIDDVFSKCDELIYGGLEKLRELDYGAVRYYCDMTDDGSKQCHTVVMDIIASCGKSVRLLETYKQIVDELNKKIKPDYDPNDAEDDSLRRLSNNFLHQVQKLSRYEALLNNIDELIG